MSDIGGASYLQALHDFQAARRAASLEAVVARLQGRSDTLLPFEEVRKALRARETTPRGLQDVPLPAIVGSVGRYRDFTRSFLPKSDSTDKRWARVQVVMNESGKYPPVELYKIGDAYFVQDGNHRVSIARKRGDKTIQAYVTEVKTRVPLSPDTQPDELILKAELAEFLEQSQIDLIRPGAKLAVTSPGRYRRLLEEIAVQHYRMTEGVTERPPFEAAVAHWYDQHYLPVVQAIDELGLLREFPGRTETDLYVWLQDHRQRLEEWLGFTPTTESVAAELTSQQGEGPLAVARRLGERVRDAIVPPSLESGPLPGDWRRERVESRDSPLLFADILVPVSGQADGWRALEQALVIVEREGGQLHGLHTTRAADGSPGIVPTLVQQEFERRTAEAGVDGKLMLDVGEVTTTILARARWVDLVVMNVAFPPADDPLARRRSGVRQLIRSSPRPILAVPGEPSALTSALLAYDGSPKAGEALFIAAYMSNRWQIPLTVVTVGPDEGPLAHAARYLASREVAATLVHREGPVAPTLIAEADDHGCDFVLMGGYGLGSIGELVVGSTVDALLRERWGPVLICR